MLVEEQKSRRMEQTIYGNFMYDKCIPTNYVEIMYGFVNGVREKLAYVFMTYIKIISLLLYIIYQL